MDCAKTVRIYARNSKLGMKGWGRRENGILFYYPALTCTLPLVNLASSICYHSHERNNHLKKALGGSEWTV